MAHHRCTRCKQESYPRHKYLGGVYCDSCIHWIRGGGHGHRRSWLGSIWGRFADLFDSVFRPESPKRIERARERVYYARLKATQAKARDIPYNPEAGVPQKS